MEIRRDFYLIGESLIQIEKEKRGVDPEKFMAYIRTQIVDDKMYYLLLDEVQMLIGKTTSAIRENWRIC